MSREENLYRNLKSQIDKIAKHNRQGSFKTKERYHEAVDRFCKFLAKEYGLQKFANISDKHLERYVSDMQSRGLAASTIKNDLSAIRFYHDKLDHPRNQLSDNSRFNLEKRSFGGVNRAWSHDEYQAFRDLCHARGQARIAQIATLARNEGLRIHETLKLDRSAAEKAIKTGVLHVVGKGGRERDVPLSRESREMLQERIQDVERGQKLFVREGEKTHLVIKQVQNFINRNREHFQDQSREQARDQGEAIIERITFHGLRHAYAQKRYQEAIERGLTDRKARLEVSALLGHERDDVTRIYTVN
ncbi:site-specific recombinase XerD [Alicyclobacillus sacchari]|uniref:Site-specific recombinase XerD n=1 Tax=Alicyclobacillus sacchari TaxID=392010 RepID=A0A4R8L887_9BACL|nr:tyrosine-type recombinase/integrase [Alicyclobacillus sacchari]TDY38976.1 site-specific recombinase XerD [Alicyclobacillus sacchari]